MTDGYFPINNKHITFMLGIITILSILASSIIAYTITEEQTKTNIQDIKELEKDVEECKKNTATIEYIAQDVKTIKQDVKEIIKGEYSKDGTNNWWKDWPR